ncbi:hypothetical protein [Brevundimonas sp.]|uniref:hypothetical protein n=1 Tax=Brevundimonas sp. TaxID=1871086 RepID=UPI003D0C3854
MIKVLALAAAMAVSPLLGAAPTVAVSYDPCERATQDYERAQAAYQAAQQCSRTLPRACNVPQAEARRLNEARQRMREACR